jgi:hypothetical protein
MVRVSEHYKNIGAEWLRRDVTKTAKRVHTKERMFL